MVSDRSCDAGLHFSSFESRCISPEKAECNVDRAICGNEGTPWSPKFVANSRDCGNYFLCLGTTSVSMRCAPGLQFDNEFNWCDMEETVNCTVCL